MSKIVHFSRNNTDAPLYPYSIYFYVDSVPFSADVIEGRTSLGGSESACLGLARALAARGHDVHVFATKMEEGTSGIHDGVTWHPAETELIEVLKFASPDIFISLRMPDIFGVRPNAKLNILWNQDLLVHHQQVVGRLMDVDVLAYVSEFHRDQWQAKSDDLKSLTSWVVENGIDLSLLPKVSNNLDLADAIASGAPRFIHITRPERGLDRVLDLWPHIKEMYPLATLKIARYSSMYDATGWGQVCAAYDRRVQQVKVKTGGIEYLGELSKPQLYSAISQAHLMLYPNSEINGFAETNCIACTESQACGTPFIGSWQGALPETLHPDAGILIEGDTKEPAVQQAFLDAIRQALDPTLHNSMAIAGMEWAERCDFTRQAVQWEAKFDNFFTGRSATHQLPILRRLLNDDDHAAARVLCLRIFDTLGLKKGADISDNPVALEVQDALDLCTGVISQTEQTADHYAEFACQDPEQEASTNARLHNCASMIVQHLAAGIKSGTIRTPTASQPLHVLDMACGNGSFAIVLHKLAKAASIPVRTHGVDYSEGVLALARKAADKLGLDSDYHQGDLHYATTSFEEFDAAFCGEYLEHVEHPHRLIDALDLAVAPHGIVVMSTPCGPFSELLGRGTPRQRGHVHSFDYRDITALFRPKGHFSWSYLEVGRTPRLNPVGYWMVSFRPRGGPAGRLDYDRKLFVARPYSRIACCMIVKDAATTIRQAIDPLHGVVDSITILDTGSTDDTLRVLDAWHGNVRPSATITRLNVVSAPWPDDFGIARNLSIQAAVDAGLLDPSPSSFDYIFWMDADEVLNNPSRLHQHATGRGPYLGTSIRQWHWQLDRPNFHDKPIRLYRASSGARFYGCVHEQPGMSLNESILPALMAEDVFISHTGYVSQDHRDDKLKHRNLPLLRKELAGEGPHPARELAFVLAMRDYLNLASFSRSDSIDATGTDDGFSEAALHNILRTITIYDSHHFSDPANQFHEVAFPYYQQALGWLAESKRSFAFPIIHTAWSFAAAHRQLPRQKVETQFIYARSVDELTGLINHKLSNWLDPFKPFDLRLAPIIRLHDAMLQKGGWGHKAVNPLVLAGVGTSAAGTWPVPASPGVDTPAAQGDTTEKVSETLQDA